MNTLPIGVENHYPILKSDKKEMTPQNSKENLRRLILNTSGNHQRFNSSHHKSAEKFRKAEYDI